MNGFRAVADFLHALAVVLLLGKILKAKTVNGISGKSQILFALTYTCRYFDVYVIYLSLYNTLMKAFYLSAFYLALYLIFIHYRSNEASEQDSFRFEFLVLGCALVTIVYPYQLDAFRGFVPPPFDVIFELFWEFSIYLEAVAIIPQLYMLRNVKIDNSMTCYLLALATYRGLYIGNWIYRYNHEGYYDPLATVCGCIYVMIYVAFFLYRLQTKEERSARLKAQVYERIPPIPVDSKIKPYM
ncbi:unnamed protein product [Bursaphelenchus xylophilus]|uniref:(pine wood nematode) hypothetical protein n=1 Tax=Bursaphelenchus xylophilus TaxID=6326 RepID=A0A1I7SR80_BURXY|nr:unnamed protein product [Bursaphelenchus xylophilus]CAG9110952.1 unnamed protein product [Bursaphelenchus xylophilus]